MKFLALLFLCASLGAQCSHPAGVTTLAGSKSCNNMNRDPVVYFTVQKAPSASISVPLRFVWTRTPFTNVPPFAAGIVILSLRRFATGIFLFGPFVGCKAFVPLDVLVPILVPLRPGCHAAFWANIPPLVGGVGVNIYAQSAGQNLQNSKWFISNAISITVQR